MYNYVKKVLKLDFKNCSYVNENRFKKLFYEQFCYFLSVLEKLYDESYEWIYADESNFNNVRKTKKRWVSKAKMSNVIKERHVSSVNIIVAITKNRMFHYEVRRDYNNSISYSKFLDNMMLKICLNHELAKKLEEGKLIYYSDNSKVHKSKLIKKYFNRTNLIISHPPPYYPIGNPVEYVFSGIKNKFYKQVFQSQ